MLKALRRQLAKLGPAVFQLLACTWRIRAWGPLPPEPAVVAFWHGDMLPVWKYFASRRPYALVSQSRDGGLLTRLLESWGYTVIRGSSSKGSKEAWTNLVTVARQKRVLITPDGPRGPARVLKAGAVVAAHRAGVPLYLCRVHCRTAIHGTHWDHFLIPLPGAAITLEFVPFPVPPDADRDTIDRLIAEAQQLLNAPMNGCAENVPG